MKRTVALLAILIFVFWGCISSRDIYSNENTLGDSLEQSLFDNISEESNNISSSPNSEEPELYNYEEHVLRELQPIIYSVMIERDTESPYYITMLYNDIDKDYYNLDLDWSEIKQHANEQFDLWEIELQKAVDDFEYILSEEDYERIKENTAKWEASMLEMIFIESHLFYNPDHYAEVGALGSLYIAYHNIHQYKYMTFKLKYILFILEESSAFHYEIYPLNEEVYSKFKSLQFAYSRNDK